jgi:hypothetical protein
MTKRPLQIAAFVVALCFAASSSAQTIPSTDKNDAVASPEALRLVDVWLDSVQAYNKIPALSAAVVQGDKVVWSKGYGTLDAAHKIPATSQTIYSICSISKLFTSIALMQQWEAGRVRLDEPLTTYLPWATLKPLDQDGMPITLRAMLTQSAGLPRESDFPYWSGPDYPFPTHDELKAKLAEQTPLWPASRWYQYSNLGLTLVGETRFAIWQFRLLRSEQQEVLKASTLREMQRVQFTDTDWKTTRGLGFAVARDSDQTYVGHGGDCPGYHSTLSLRPATETAITAMLTGAEHPGVYAAAMFQLLDKRKAFAFKTPDAAKGVNLEDFAGRYSAQPWSAEAIIVPWAEGLAVLSLPSVNPARELTILKAKGGDVFRRVRDDGSEADEVRFERDKSGNVVRYIQFSNAQSRVGPLAPTGHQ